METLNLAVISGNIKDAAQVTQAPGLGEYCSFAVITYKSIKTESGKVKVKEEIPVVMFRPGTIAKYLTKGKAVVVQGRVAPRSEVGRDGPTMIASSVTFPGSKHHDD